MKTVEVDAAVRYNIVIDKGILPKSGDMIKEVTSAERVAVITDDTVDKLYSDVVMKSLSDAGFETFKFVFPHGEKSKNISTFSSILEFLNESGDAGTGTATFCFGSKSLHTGRNDNGEYD